MIQMNKDNGLDITVISENSSFNALWEIIYYKLLNSYEQNQTVDWLEREYEVLNEGYPDRFLDLSSAAKNKLTLMALREFLIAYEQELIKVVSASEDVRHYIPLLSDYIEANGFLSKLLPLIFTHDFRGMSFCEEAWLELYDHKALPSTFSWWCVHGNTLRGIRLLHKSIPELAPIIGSYYKIDFSINDKTYDQFLTDLNNQFDESTLYSLVSIWPDNKVYKLLKAYVEKTHYYNKKHLLDELVCYWPIDEVKDFIKSELKKGDLEDCGYDYYHLTIFIEIAAFIWRTNDIRELCIAHAKVNYSNRSFINHEDYSNRESKLAALNGLVNYWKDNITLQLLKDKVLYDEDEAIRSEAIGLLTEFELTEAIYQFLINVALKVEELATLEQLIKHFPTENTRALAVNTFLQKPNYDILTWIVEAWPDNTTKTLISEYISKNKHNSTSEVNTALRLLVEYWADEESYKLLTTFIYDAAPPVKELILKLVNQYWPAEKSINLLSSLLEKSRCEEKIAIIPFLKDSVDQQYLEKIILACISDNDDYINKRALELLIDCWPTSENIKLLETILTSYQSKVLKKTALGLLVYCWKDDYSYGWAKWALESKDYKYEAIDYLTSYEGEYVEKTIFFLMERDKKDESTYFKCCLMDGLAKSWRHKRVVRDFIQNSALYDEDIEVQEQCIALVNRCWEDEEAQQLLNKIANSKGKTKGSDDIETRESMYERWGGDESEESRLALIKQLLHFYKDDETKQFLIAQYESDISTNTRVAILCALVEVWQDNSIRVLLNSTLSLSKNEHLKLKSIELLVKYWPDDQIYEYSLSYMDSNERELRLLTVESIISYRYTKNDEVYNLLVQGVKQDSDELIRETALQALMDNWLSRLVEHGLLLQWISTFYNCHTRYHIVLKVIKYHFSDDLKPVVMGFIRNCPNSSNYKSHLIDVLLDHWVDDDTYGLLVEELCQINDSSKSEKTINYHALWGLLRNFSKKPMLRTLIFDLVSQVFLDKETQHRLLRGYIDTWPDKESYQFLIKLVADENEEADIYLQLKALSLLGQYWPNEEAHQYLYRYLEVLGNIFDEYEWIDIMKYWQDDQTYEFILGFLADRLVLLANNDRSSEKSLKKSLILFKAEKFMPTLLTVLAHYWPQQRTREAIECWAKQTKYEKIQNHALQLLDDWKS